MVSILPTDEWTFVRRFHDPDIDFVRPGLALQSIGSRHSYHDNLVSSTRFVLLRGTDARQDHQRSGHLSTFAPNSAPHLHIRAYHTHHASS